MPRLVFRQGSNCKRLIVQHNGEELVLHLEARGTKNHRKVIVAEGPESFQLRRSKDASQVEQIDELVGQQHLLD